jgi:hypothetical protein
MISATVKNIINMLIPFTVLYVGTYFCSFYFLVPTW